MCVSVSVRLCVCVLLITAERQLQCTMVFDPAPLLRLLCPPPSPFLLCSFFVPSLSPLLSLSAPHIQTDMLRLGAPSLGVSQQCPSLSVSVKSSARHWGRRWDTPFDSKTAQVRFACPLQVPSAPLARISPRLALSPHSTPPFTSFVTRTTLTALPCIHSTEFHILMTSSLRV